MLKSKAVFVGNGSLLVNCAELYLQAGHEIAGVSTTNEQISDWLESQNIPNLGPLSTLSLDHLEFDYLFSVMNLEILPDELISRAQKMAINFHDALLPGYAGLNAPSWAIMNKEEEHGVTWHEMATVVDAGRILKQKSFEIYEADTVFNVNTKCYQAGLEGFKEMVSEITSGTLNPVEQVGERSYFGKTKRPEALATLDFNKPADDITALIRALDYGQYPHPLGFTKIWTGETLFLVSSVDIEENQSGQMAGSIVAFDDNSLVVATGQGDIRLSNLRCLKGQPVNPVASGLFTVGQILSSLSEEQKTEISGLSKKVARKQDFWLSEFNKVKPVELPYPKSSENSETGASYYLTEPRQVSFGQDKEQLLLCFASWLAILAEQNEVSFAYLNQQDQTNYPAPWYCAEKVINFNLDTNDNPQELLINKRAALEAFTSSTPFFGDLLASTVDNKLIETVTQALQIGLYIGTPGELKPTNKDIVVILDPITGSVSVSTNSSMFDKSVSEAINEHFITYLNAFLSLKDTPVQQLPLVPETEKALISQTNATEVAYDQNATIDQLIAEKIAQVADQTALICGHEKITYAELETRSNALAAQLQSRGIVRGNIVGICLDRSVDLVVSMVAIHKAGAAYLPLDPDYPKDRIQFMIGDSGAPLIISNAEIASKLEIDLGKVFDIKSLDLNAAANYAKVERESSDLAYLIYTSGSTGLPKGVMVEHRNAVNFFVGMDDRIKVTTGVWLAVTSMSFDISVLELLYTLTRGFTVVIYKEPHKNKPAAQKTVRTTSKSIDFGLFYFASEESENPDNRYQLLLEGAKFADKNGFTSVSIPERHFHAFGGLYPNPSVAAAAVAAITENVQIRSGSVVLPLHHPARVAEDWALVDNLSKGRVALSFASGWQPVDFVIRPEAYKERHKIMYESIDAVQRLWRGEKVAFSDADGTEHEIQTFPRPIQKELPLWVTSAGNIETWKSAARTGAHILTHLLGQSEEDIAEKIKVYRQCRAEAGYDPDGGKVTLMLHTFVGDSKEQVREVVRQPMKNYLKSSFGLVKNVLSSWAAFKRREDGTMQGPGDFDPNSMSPEEMEDLLEFSFHRYFETSGLFGTPEECLEMVNRLANVGVDEIACLIDFGVSSELSLKHLAHLNRLKELSNQETTEVTPVSEDETIADLIVNYGVTHFQCTPSMASMILLDDQARSVLGNVGTFMIGGEAFPTTLAKDLRSVAGNSRIINMYGPTETTIWSSTQDVAGDEKAVSIGLPIANTQLYILNNNYNQLPVGIPGELYIGGDGVVRGYHQREELTAERFIPNPFDTSQSTRIYKTGDLARWMPDGRIDFLGRSDHQVKIRGYRIELGEIESLLAQHVDVREAVVIAREDVPGDVRLAAYLIAKQKGIVNVESLKSSLRKKLPEFMVPAHYIELEVYPKTPNNKIDRKALPAPEQFSSLKGAAQDDEEANDIEVKILDVWKDVLGIQNVRLEDNFFDLGGHSLLAVKAQRSLQEFFPGKISIVDLFRYPTVKTLANYLSADGDNANLEKSQDRGANRRERMSQRRQSRMASRNS